MESTNSIREMLVTGSMVVFLLTDEFLANLDSDNQGKSKHGDFKHFVHSFVTPLVGKVFSIHASTSPAINPPAKTAMISSGFRLIYVLSPV
jgi:hypothetical protein